MAERRYGTCVLLVPLFLLSYPQTAPADVISVAFVTCIPNTAASCPEAGVGDQFRWRVVNVLSSTSNGYATNTDLLDIGLTFQYAGGSSTWHWEVVHGGEFVETDLLDIALLPKLALVSLSATLPYTTFNPVFRGDDYMQFAADGPFLSATQSMFPPPLLLSAPGTFSRPTPEPTSILLFGTGVTAVALRVRSRRARRGTLRRS